ncbi:MAG: hypothetical protein KAJ95_11035 [Gammaproteobacteria bacterium]|nr:hypothetical protein [Gammaproteobacteria bacterium]
MINPRQRDHVVIQVNEAQASGASAFCGGAVFCTDVEKAWQVAQRRVISKGR